MILGSPRLLLCLIFTFGFILSYIYASHTHLRDPTSFFYRPERAYDVNYSLMREFEADSLIDLANDKPARTKSQTISHANYCVGIATVARPGKQYVSQAVGSILQGLSDAERDDIHLILFFAHSDPTIHPAYNQSWTKVLPDTLLKYDARDEEQMLQIQQWEKENNYKKKGLYDYEYLLRACQDTKAEYIVMLEGDVLAVQGWFPRVKSALQVVERSTTSVTPSRISRNFNALIGSSSINILPGDELSTPRWLYLRLFYTEMYLGWNSEEWSTYLFHSVLIFLSLNITLLLLRRFVPALHLQTHLPNSTLLLITCVFLPIGIIFWYMSGRELHPTHSSYAYRMDRYGCCSQGLVFSAKQLPLIYEELKAPRMEYIDMMMEAVAEGRGLERWTIWPSVLQHVGITSSKKGDLVADARARMVWNFGFEKYGKGGALW